MHSRWRPTLLDIGVAATVWPQALLLAQVIALIVAVWGIRAAVGSIRILLYAVRHLRPPRGRHR